VRAPAERDVAAVGVVEDADDAVPYDVFRLIFAAQIGGAERLLRTAAGCTHPVSGAGSVDAGSALSDLPGVAPVQSAVAVGFELADACG
jgi:hypothetical protein